MAEGVVYFPLMAISGYAENVLNGKLTEAEQTEYLNLIPDHVSFADSLISRTLYLNHIGGKCTSNSIRRLRRLSKSYYLKIFKWK